MTGWTTVRRDSAVFGIGEGPLGGVEGIRAKPAESRMSARNPPWNAAPLRSSPQTLAAPACVFDAGCP